MANHADLTGADLHEPKGAASAAAGLVMRANGTGGTSWVSPLSMTNIQFASTIVASRSANILPSALDTPLTAGFDANVSNSDISINTSGTITAVTAGLYACTFNMNFGRTTATGTAVLSARLLKNGVQLGFTQGATLADNVNSRPMQANLEIPLLATDVLQVQIMRDSSGANEGGLIAIPITPVSWGDIPSYWVRVRKIVGAS